VFFFSLKNKDDYQITGSRLPDRMLIRAGIDIIVQSPNNIISYSISIMLKVAAIPS